MTVQLAPSPVFQAIGSNGLPVAFGFLYTYVAGTATPQASYIDSTQTTQNTNPVQLNALGQANVWLNISQTYKLVLTDSLGNQIWVVDQVPGGFLTPSALTQTLIGSILYPQTTAEIAASVTPINYGYPPGDIRRYGAVAGSSSDSTTALTSAASQAAQSGGAPITVGPGVYTLNSNLTTAQPVVFSGGQISTTVSHTWTITGNLNAARQQIFAGAGAVILGQYSCQEAYPEWWGAIANSTATSFGTDCTSALTAAITACSEGSLVLGSGIGVVPLRLDSGYYLTGQQILTPAFTLRGTGRKSSGFIAKAGTSGVWFTDNGNAAGIILEDFALYGNSANCASMTQIINLGYNGTQHGSEGYIRGIWPRDCACSGSTFAVDINANVGFYDLISIYGNVAASSGSSLLRVIGAGNMLSKIVLQGQGANAYSLYLNAPGSSVHGVEIEAPGSCSSSFAPLSIQHDAYISGCIISVNNAANSTFDHLWEVGASAFSWSVVGLELFQGTGSFLATVTGGNAYNIAKTSYFGGTLQASAGNYQGCGSYTSAMSNVLSGTAAFSAATTAAVTLPWGQTVSTYRVALSQSATSTSPPWITSKTANGFTINFSANFTGNVDWQVSLP